MPTFASLQNRKSELIRKALDGSVWIADYTATAVTAITDTTASALPIALPAGYTDVGWLDKGDGVTFGADVDASDTTSWGSASPNRRDINSKTTTMQFTAQETKKAVLEMYYGQSLTGVTPHATSGEVKFDEPTIPSTRYLRVLSIAKDGSGADTIYIGTFFPRASVSDVSELTNKDDEETKYGVTVTAYNDSVLGTPVTHFFGGPGWLALTGAKHGFV